MNSNEYKELKKAYKNVYEQQIGVPTNNPDATLRKIIKSDPKKYGGGEVVPSNPTKSANIQNAHLDLFDIIKGYLLDEGHADTEEEAIAIMANMSEDAIKDIVEQDPHMNPTPFNIMKAREQARGGVAHRRHVHQEIGAEARAQQAAKQSRMRAIMSR